MLTLACDNTGLDEMYEHDQLIDELVCDAVPVRRTWPVWMRLSWLVPLVLVLGAISTLLLNQRQVTNWTAPYAIIAAANMVTSLVIGTIALSSALSISIAGGVTRGGKIFRNMMVVWLAISAISINLPAHKVGNTYNDTCCFVFIITAGTPMIAIIILELRRTLSFNPIRSLVSAGCGVSFLSFALLAMCHSVELSISDLIQHLCAALILGAVTVGLGWRVIAI